jgi:hypothetical protein
MLDKPNTSNIYIFIFSTNLGESHLTIFTRRFLVVAEKKNEHENQFRNNSIKIKLNFSKKQNTKCFNLFNNITARYLYNVVFYSR